MEVEEETENVVEKADENEEDKQETTKMEEKQDTTEVVTKSEKTDLKQKQVTTNGGKESERENNFRSVSRKIMADSKEEEKETQQSKKTTDKYKQCRPGIELLAKDLLLSESYSDSEVGMDEKKTERKGHGQQHRSKRVSRST
ncbi:uncharacterized protein LOC143231592 [Tachypleus tridentatus]|uniref:uncharacterized protein LOC143231592 n=1 Tax=Tachypleus tridentatus TaxID=6853 RepID=UPI003FCFC400